MMAAAANADRSVEAIVTSDSEPQSVRISSDFQDVNSNHVAVNGASAPATPDELENKHISDIVDDLVNSAEPSISGGSDSEASRPFKSRDDAKGHARTSSSVKKPATFKSVSVNKTFLATKGPPGPAPIRVSEKPAPSAGPASTQALASSASSARPRLVAKTGSGLGNSLGRSAGAAGGRPAATPDPNAVWNKNRPVPPPEPKKFTDEELKKYGIHMATRLGPDDAKGQANNWADIDDDDEDWAPDEIRWTDGTKSTLPHLDEPPAPSPEPIPSPAPVAAQIAAQVAAPVTAPVTAPITAPLTAPVNAQAAAPTAVLSREIKPVEKPRSPAPMVSPSAKPGVLASGKGLVLKGAPEKPTLVAKPPAPLTPVKSPWATLPPVDKASPIVMDIPQHASRMQPRDVQPPTSEAPPPPFKEIAADDFSRSAFRDAHPQQNRELYNSQSGRLEPVNDRRGGMRSDPYSRPPPAVLQRPSQSDQPEPSAAFQTHRTSGQEPPYGRRRNSSNVSGGSGSFLQQRTGRPLEQPLPPPELLSARRESLTGGSDSPASPRNFSPADQRPPHGHQPWQPRVSPATSFATPYNVVPSDPRAPAQRPPVAGPVAGPAAGPAAENEFEIQKRVMREKREEAKKRRLEEEAREEAAKQERIRLKLEAMGPAPERKSAKKDNAQDPAPTSAAPKAQPTENQTATHADGSVAAYDPSATDKSEMAPNGMRSPVQQIQHPQSGEDALSVQDGKTSQPWQGSTSTQPERLSSWGSGSQASSHNVWAAPSSNRSLGNGTFSSDLGRVRDSYPSQPAQMTAKSTPGPIGPPAAQKATPAPIAPIGPPKPTSSAGAGTGATRSAWASAVRDKDTTLFAERQAQRAEQQRDLDARGLTAQDARASIKDNWKPTKMNDDGRRIEEKERQTVTHGSAAWKASAEDRAQLPPAPGQASKASVPLGSGGASAGSQQGRSSRFFPARDARQDEAAAGEGAGRSKSPSPPPPDTVGHPAFDGDTAHPHVALPPPTPVVRLPPRSQQPAEAPVPPQAARWAPPQPFIAPASGPPRFFSEAPQFPPPKADWQAKFDNLFDRKPTSPPKSAIVDSSSRIVSDAVSQRLPAPASHPSLIIRNLNTGLDGSVVSKAMAETCFEEQETGSLPPVRLPTEDFKRTRGWSSPPPPRSVGRRFMVAYPTSVDQEQFLRDGFGPSNMAGIRLPGMARVKIVTLPSLESRNNPRRSNYGRGGARHASGAPRGPNKPRDPSSSHSSEYSSSQGSSQPPAGRGRGGGGFRARSENWSRRPSTPLQT